MTGLYERHTPTKKYRNVLDIKNDDLGKNEMLSYFHCILKSSRHKVNTSPELLAFNRFASQGIKMIIQTGFEVDRIITNNRNTTAVDKGIKSFRIKATFLDATLDTPKTIDRSGVRIPRNPDDYRITNDAYFANLIVTVQISITAQKADGTEETKETTLTGLSISAIPIMVRSSHCNTYKMSTDMLKKINEDPTDTGGYFIAGGKEYVINATENIGFNRPLIFKSTLKTQKVYMSEVGLPKM